MKRVWHPFWAWEDIGMWRDVTAAERRALLPLAVEFTGDAVRYGEAMCRVVSQFPIACEHNLTERAANQQAWIGHAAAFLAINCPEYITREAWGLLSDEQRIAADEQAASAIKLWRADRGLLVEVASEGIRTDSRGGTDSSGRLEQGPVLSADLQGNPEKRPVDSWLHAAKDTGLHGAEAD